MSRVSAFSCRMAIASMSAISLRIHSLVKNQSRTFPTISAIWERSSLMMTSQRAVAKTRASKFGMDSSTSLYRRLVSKSRRENQFMMPLRRIYVLLENAGIQLWSLHRAWHRTPPFLCHPPLLGAEECGNYLWDELEGGDFVVYCRLPHLDFYPSNHRGETDVQT